MPLHGGRNEMTTRARHGGSTVSDDADKVGSSADFSAVPRADPRRIFSGSGGRNGLGARPRSARGHCGLGRGSPRPGDRVSGPGALPASAARFGRFRRFPRSAWERGPRRSVDPSDLRQWRSDPGSISSLSLSLEGLPHLDGPCLPTWAPECWSVGAERFIAEAEDVERVAGHSDGWVDRGVEIVAVRTSVVCGTQRLVGRAPFGHNRFIVDLYAMGSGWCVVLRALGGTAHVLAVCGKSGGMDDITSIFPARCRDGLHTELNVARPEARITFRESGRRGSCATRTPGDCLVMLAFIVGKYVRELLMARGRISIEAARRRSARRSGYHDPVTARFVDATSLLRRERRIPDGCFERDCAVSRDS